jgi:glycosyltransferase involved in cell wall biosynthesis
VSTAQRAPCRVLVLNERDLRHPKAGGAETHVFEIMSRLAKEGWRISLFASGFPGAPPRELVDGVEVRRFGALARYYPSVALACARATRAGRFDVVVECLNKMPFFAPVYSAAPVLALCHHLFGETAFRQVAWPIAAAVWSAERLIPLVYRRQRFLAISESSRDDLVRRGVPAERIDVSYCGIRRPAPTLPLPALGERPRSVSYVGRLEPYKGIDVLLRAAARLLPHFPDLELVLIGRGSARARLEALAGELGLAPRTRFVGFVTDDERDALLARSRVCVCPSEKEGWGLTVIEANAVGTPVVASDAPGLRESVRSGETGFLVRVGDVEGFADRIGALLRADEAAEGMAAAALAWSRRFDWDRASDEMAAAIAAARAES